MKKTGNQRHKRRGLAKAVLLLLCLVLAAGMTLMFGCGEDIASEPSDETESIIETTGYSRLSSTEDIGLYDMYSSGTNYAFTYHGEEFLATYYYDNWTIYDSYKITNKHDMKIICQALIDIYPIHGRDMVSYRTADDMAYEWKQHNLACKVLPEDSPWRESAENVDFDPADQGKSIKELYEDRKGTE